MMKNDEEHSKNKLSMIDEGFAQIYSSWDLVAMILVCGWGFTQVWGPRNLVIHIGPRPSNTDTEVFQNGQVIPSVFQTFVFVNILKQNIFPLLSEQE